MVLYLSLFLAGLLTILLPCILPLIPVVVGVSIAGRNRWRPLFVVLGMVVSFVFFTMLLLVVLRQFIELADMIRIAMFVALLLFGAAFVTENRMLRICTAVIGGLFFLEKGWVAVVVAALVGIVAFEVAGRIVGRIQQTGLAAQNAARSEFGTDTPLTAFVIGLTLGLIWVPCAGPALGFALTLVRDEPGLRAVLALLSYALGTALPLILIGYGGQRAVGSVRYLSRYTGIVKRAAGILLILTALALQFRFFETIQIFLLENTSYGDLGTRIEEKLLSSQFLPSSSASSTSSASSRMSTLPTLSRAPEFTGLGPWHNSEPFTLASLKGKVVLVDFWTYSCINCIRTLPYIQGYWDKFKGTDGFVILAVHSPEFTFEKSEKNVAMAIKEHGLTYPVAQDNDFGTWKAFANRYWPAKYLIDANGYIRYTHFGEGAYEETDAAIESLLKEAGVETSGERVANSGQDAKKYSGSVTPETYLSSRSWPAFGNQAGDPSAGVTTYTIPSSLTQNKYYLAGSWQLVDDEAQVLRSDAGEIRMQFRGGEMNLVLGLADGAVPVQASVTIDGKPGVTFTIDRHDLYNLFSGEYGDHDVTIKLTGAGVAAFAFTFGG